MDVTTMTGVLAACCTTASYFPQLKKCWETEETGDLSLGMFSTLFAGLTLWVVYGVLRSDADSRALAIGLLSALQGGYLLAKASRDVYPMRAALDMAIAQLRAYATETDSSA